VNVRALFSDWLSKFKRAYREGDEVRRWRGSLPHAAVRALTRLDPCNLRRSWRQEFERRFAVFHANALFVREFNAEGHSHKARARRARCLRGAELLGHRAGSEAHAALARRFR
jgi:hypothetical protein